MAFANLFANLPALHGDVNGSAEPAFTAREETAKGKRDNARKRKAEEEQFGSYNKKQRCQVEKTTTYNLKDDNIKAVGYHTPCTARGPGGYNKEEINNHIDKAAPSIRHHKGQNYKTGNNCEVSKLQHQEKKRKWQKNQQKPLDKGRQANGGRRVMLRTGPRCHQDARQDFTMKPPRFMSQEFKDQNALEVDGQLLCLHFIRGRCIKADSCQLKHVQSYNGLVKTVCKFYIQGFCTKGESCPYMHKSFPCKFFHTKGKCFQGADCKFSHEPLNDDTNRLLEEALKRDSELYELAKKAEEESSGQLPNTAESKIIEANENPPILTQPLKPNFYNSRDAAKEALCLTEEQPDHTDEALLTHASDAGQLQSPPSTTKKEPVCYSVEASLGPQLSRPFPNFFTAPGSQECTTLSVPQMSSDATLGSTNQREAPYSVDAFLRSFKSVENSTFGQRPTATTVKTVSYSPKNDCKESSKPLLSSQNRKLSPNTRDEANKSLQKMFNSLPSFQMHTGLISKTCPDRSFTSEDHTNRCGDVPESITTAHRTSHEVKLELCSPDTQVEKSVSSEGKGDMKESQTCPHAQLKPHLSGLTSNSQSSIKPFSPPVGFSEFKGRAAVEPLSCFVKKSGTSESPSHHFAERQRTECDLKLSTRQHYSAKTSPECSSEMTDLCDLSDACKKNQKRPFYSLFANPLSDSMMSAHPRGFIQAPRCVNFTSTDLKTAAEPDKPPSTSFLSLFAAPLIYTAASSPCLQSQPDYSRTRRCRQKSADDTIDLSKRRPPNLESPPPCEAGTDVTQTPHRRTPLNFSSSPKDESVNQPVNPVCGLVSDSLSEISTSTAAPESRNPSPSSTQQQLSNISSPRDSVLKSLFLRLSPYQENREQQDSIRINAPPGGKL